MLNIPDPDSEFFRNQKLQPISREANTRYFSIQSKIEINHAQLYELMSNGLNVMGNLLYAGYFEHGAKLISQKNYDVNQEDFFGNTISHIFEKLSATLKNEAIAIIKFLLSSKTNFYQPNKMGIRGIDLIQSKFHLSLQEQNIIQLDHCFFNTSINGNTLFEVEQSSKLGKILSNPHIKNKFYTALCTIKNYKILNFKDYIFAFIKTADASLIEEFLKFLRYYETNLTNGSKNIANNLRNKDGTLMHAVVHYRKGDPNLIHLLNSYGVDFGKCDGKNRVVWIDKSINHKLILEQTGRTKRRNWCKYTLSEESTTEALSQDL